MKNESTPAFPVIATGSFNIGLTKLEYISTEIAKSIISQNNIDTEEDDERKEIAFQSIAIAKEILKRTSE